MTVAFKHGSGSFFFPTFNSKLNQWFSEFQLVVIVSQVASGYVVAFSF